MGNHGDRKNTAKIELKYSCDIMIQRTDSFVLFMVPSFFPHLASIQLFKCLAHVDECVYVFFFVTHGSNCAHVSIDVHLPCVLCFCSLCIDQS